MFLHRYSTTELPDSLLGEDYRAFLLQLCLPATNRLQLKQPPNIEVLNICFPSRRSGIKCIITENPL